MADKLVFPIGFDLESGLKQAQADINRTIKRLEGAIKSQSVKLPVGFDAAMAKKLREEAKDIERVLANIKNHYGNGQLKGLSIGFINTQKELEGIKRLNAQLQSLREQRTSLVNAGATEQELKRIDSAIKQTEQRLKELNYAFNRDNSFNIAISQQIIRLKQLSEELAGIDRMYARLQASSTWSANSFEANEILARRRVIMEEIARITRTAAEAQKELFNIKGVGIGASQTTYGYGGEQGLSAITAQIERYERLKIELREVEGQYERLKAMQAQGMGDQSEKINQTLQRRIAIQKELGDITQTAAQAQKALEENAKKTAAAFQRGRSAIDNFNRTMRLPENRIMNIQAKINALNQALKRVGIGSTEFNKIVAELNRLGQKLDEAKAKQQALSSEQEKGIKKATGAFREQKSYLNVLTQRLAVYSSMGAVMGFLTKVREVTAQFELQRVSLGAIINDQVRANALFNEIRQFALQSPIKILDLTKYTKQMAAFRFETDSLFESTKRMADISVGLSVPMDRLILALGHVKAATHLTGITLRQFSMAGIPMLGLLAEKYSELEGRAVSVADVQKRVHDKMVSFEDVNQIFTDLTSKGGMFYNMQIKQGNTLYGLWAKLGDAASVMYEQIGNTPFINEGMKDAINMLTIMMRNWRDVARVATEAGIAFGIYKLAVMASTKATALATVWNKKDILLRQMHLKTVMAQSWSVRNFNKVLLASGVSAQKASTATWVFSRALNGLRAAIATTGIGLLVVGVGLLIDRLIFGKSAADELAESLDRIKFESSQEQDKSVANFERLANVATSSTSSYKQQQEALEELRRTYKSMISEEMLTIENLKSLNGHYEQLTTGVRAYINEQMKQKQIDEITNTYAHDILKIQRKVRDELKDKYSDEQLMEFWDRYAKNVKDKTKSAGKSIADLISLTASEMGASMQFAHDLGSAWTLWARDHADISRMTSLMRDQESQIDALGKVYDSTSMAMGKFADSYNEAVNSIKENGVSLNGNILNEKDNPLLFSQQEANLEVKDAMVPTIKEAFEEAGMAFDEGWVSLIDNIDENAPNLTSSINFEPMIEKAKSESKRLQDELQKQLELLIAQREAYMKQIQAEEGKGKGKNDEAIANMKAQYNSLGESITELEEKAKSVNAVLPLLDSLRKKFENIAPSDPVVKIMRKRFDQIVDYTKSYAKNMRRFRMDADESMEAYRKRLTDEVDLIKKNIKAWTAAMVLARLFRNKTEEQNLQNLISEAKLQLADLEKILGDMPEFEKSKGSGRKSDPRLQTLQEIANKMAEVNKEYDELLKKEGQTKALADTQKLFASSFKQMQDVAKKYNFKLPAFEVPQTVADVQKWYKAIMDNIKRLNLKNADKVLIELGFKSDKLSIDKQQKDIEKQLKILADRISRTKTAREFYEKILSQSGDMRLALRLSTDIFGGDGSALNKQIAEQVRSMVSKTSATLPDAVFNADFSLNTKAMRRWAEVNKDLLGDTYNELVKMADEADKDMAKTIEGWLKATEKAKTYGDKLTDTYRKTSTEIERIQAAMANGKLDSAVGSDLIKGYRRKEAEEIAQLQYEAFKESPLYVQMFDDLDHASTKMLENMKSRLIELKGQWSNLDPTQLKEMQSRLNEIDAQLAKRNPFKTLADGLREYIKLRTKGDARGNTSRNMADNDVLQWTDAYTKAQEELAAVMNDKTASEARIAGAKQMVDYTKRQKEEAERTAENWKKVEDSIGLSAGELMQMLNWAGDIAGAIADISEAMGADTEDVQYWDNVASALGDISAGIQDIVQSAMSGNVVGAVSSVLTAIPKMFVGFSNLFSAGKIRKANKEIKRQQELLEQLEYSYSRLEKAADRLFGGDYISNYNKQMQVLQAQQTAYLRMAEAERSKGKKEDKAKTQEYLNQARDVADRIKDMESDLTAHFIGTDRASAAREFARSWLEAKATFASTSDAIKSKYKDMIQSMIVEGAAARIIENALTPLWNQMDSLLERGDTYGAIDYLISGMDSFVDSADRGMNVLWESLKAKGYDMQTLLGDQSSGYTGIKRDIATASEESITGLAAHMNTVEYYVAQIHQNVAAIATRGGGSPALSGFDYSALIQQSVDRLAMIERYSAEILVECRRNAIAAESALAEIRKVIAPRGTKKSHSVQVAIS